MSIQKLGPYKLIKKLGEGAMGLVYLAEDTQAQRLVALKVLSSKLAAEEHFLKRFRREAIATGKLNHINIVGAYACDQENGYHYYAMEYCDGEPLDHMLKKLGKFPASLAVDVIKQVAGGLQHAHKHNIVHRDIKPANIFLTRDKVAKILDLGLSKSVGDASQSHMTMAGTAVGTPHYISPEQARGETDVDGRADIYSLGATFYLLATGRTPYEGNSPGVIMAKHLTAPVPDPLSAAPTLPRPLARIIVKMMQKEPHDRYQSCAEILEDLERFERGEAPLLGGSQPPSDAPHSDERRGGMARAAAGGGNLPPRPKQARKLPSGRHLPVAAHGKARAASPTGDGPENSGDDATDKPSRASGASERQADEDDGSVLDTAEPPARSGRSGRGTAQVPAVGARPAPLFLLGAIAGVVVLGVAVGMLFSNSGNSDNAQKLTPGQQDAPRESHPQASRENDGEPNSEATSTPEKPEEPEEPKDPKEPKSRTPEPRITLAPPPPRPQPVAPIEPDTSVADLPGVPTEPVPPPAPIPAVARAPLAAVENAALEQEAPHVFNRFALKLKNRQLPEAQAMLDDLQNRFAATKWYAQNHGMLDAGYFYLDCLKQPWGKIFATAARPLDGPGGDRWDLHYDNFTYAAYERREWQLLAGTKLAWQVGSWNLDHAGAAVSGLVCTLPFVDLERIEATLSPRQGTTCGWGLFADARAVTPYVACYTDNDGRIWVTDGRKTTTLKLRMPAGGDERQMVAYFRKNRAWIEVGGRRELVRIPAPPQGLMLPGWVQTSGAVRVSGVRVQGAFQRNYVKTLAAANERSKRLREGEGARYDVKITVASEFPCAVYVGSTRARPDAKGAYIPQDYKFTMRPGSLISILQFNGNVAPTGPVLVNLRIEDKQTGTGLTPHFWSANDEMGNWQNDAAVFPGWLPLPQEAEKTEIKSPPGAAAKYVMPGNRGVLLHYVFDPGDFKNR